MATVLSEEVSDAPEVAEESPLSALVMLARIAQSTDDISAMLDENELTKIGGDVARDYETDCQDRHDWEVTAEKSLKRAAQEYVERPKDAPAWRGSYVDYPLLTVAAQQFNARAYPAICKPGSIVKVKVIGSDKGRPEIDQATGKQAMRPVGPPQPANDTQAGPPAPQAGQPAPDAPQAAAPPPMEPVWRVPPGFKQKRADRVGEYLNVYVEYRMKGWEEETDRLLFQMAIVGCGFRKLYWRDGVMNSVFVPALDLVVPINVTSLKDSPRCTQRLNDVYPFKIRERMNAGFYRKQAGLLDDEDEQKPRLLLEQHRLMDLDGDGVDEPYVVTIDHETSQVLRIEADFGVDEIHLSDDDTPRAMKIDRRSYFVKYSFLPDPRGRFYDIGFGALLYGEGEKDSSLGEIINTTINQLFDAGRAQIAGGGFIASGLRLQNAGRNATLRWEPGEYKTVDATGGDIRSGLIERTFPSPSPIMFQLMEFILGAAKDITSVKDIVTGDAKNTAPVGTTLALIEQGLQVFTAIYKRVYRALGEEFSMIFDALADYGGEETAADYTNVLDDDAADFQTDFADNDMDIKPVADPSSVTKMQQTAKASFLLGMSGRGLNEMEINRRALEAAGIEDIDALIPQGAPQPDPMMLTKLRESATQSDLNIARAAREAASAQATVADTAHKIGESSGYAG